jgi:glycosyltransferase involved in cell wall biosynthesis
VDDGSTDGTVKFLGEIEDPRLVLIRAERNGGASYARNLGLEKARGELIAFLDSDDTWMPSFLEEQQESFRAESDAAISSPDIEFKSSKGTGRVFSSRLRLRDRTLRENLLWHFPFLTLSSVVVPRALIEKIGGFNEEYGVAEDLDLYLRLSKLGRYAHIPKVLVVKRDSEDGLLRDYSAWRVNVLSVIERAAPDLPSEVRRKIYSRFLAQMALFRIRWRRDVNSFASIREVSGLILDSLKIDPLALFTLIREVKSS